MNRLLIGILDLLNKLLALLIITSSTIGGYRGDLAGFIYLPAAGSAAERVVWTVAGFIIGLALAGLFSGLLAAIITIAREMIALRELLTYRGPSGRPPPV